MVMQGHSRIWGDLYERLLHVSMMWIQPAIRAGFFSLEIPSTTALLCSLTRI
ncbi:hypothetical protein B0G81_5888 [Paraburkholderia sp. BL6665CI2N2]|nr:hypothetical protein B0G81_5888 [Paraburkholderia sp. BL6665CI2N2]